MTVDVFIAGAGGFAKEVYLILDRLKAAGSPLRCAGFVDLHPESHELVIGDDALPILEQAQFMESHAGAKLALGVAFPRLMARVKETFAGWDFETLVDPSVQVHHATQVGRGSVISGAVQLSVNIQIGEFNAIGAGVIIGHDSTLGSGNVINPGAVISGYVTVGSGAMVGSGATVLQGLEVEDGATVGAGAVVTKSVPKETVVMGVPARS